MECDNCQSSDGIAFTLRTFVEGEGESIDLHFCSSNCLDGWT